MLGIALEIQSMKYWKGLDRRQDMLFTVQKYSKEELRTKINLDREEGREGEEVDRIRLGKNTSALVGKK